MNDAQFAVLTQCADMLRTALYGSVGDGLAELAIENPPDGLTIRLDQDAVMGPLVAGVLTLIEVVAEELGGATLVDGD